MLFIHPMWYSESERTGTQKCSPTGYVLRGIADIIGLLGLVFLFVVPAVLVWNWFSGVFQASLWWLFALPFGLGAVSEALFQFSCSLSRRRGFHYDYEKDEASWLEAGELRRYKYGTQSGAALGKPGDSK